MNKKLILSYITVAVLMAVFSWGMIGLPETNDQHFSNFSVMGLRILVPILVKFLSLLSISPDWCLVIILFTSGMLSFWSLRNLMKNFVSNELYYVLTFVIIYLLLLNHRTPADFITVFLFCLAFTYILQDDNRFFIVFLFAVLHRETSILLIGFYFLYRNHIRNTLVMLMTFIIIRATIMYFANNSQGNLEYLFRYDVMGAYLTSWGGYFLAGCLLWVGRILYSKWNTLSYYLKAGVALFTLQVVLHILVGNPFEIRVMAEFTPLLITALIA